MEFVAPILTSLFISILAIPPVIKLAKKYGLVDHPSFRPHPAHTQNRIVPRAGGLPSFIAITITILLFIPIDQKILGILASISILVVIGLIDDKYHNFSPYLRLFGQILAATVAVGSGIGINFITNPLGGILHLNQNLDLIFFTLQISDILAVIWIVWVMNMINWSKGVDGQMPSITTACSLIIGLLSLKFFLSGDPNQLLPAKLAFITAASSMALLIFNWYPAKIFPGFSASTVLGFMIAILAILSGGKLATAGLALLIPATDFLYIFIRRLLQGKSPVWGDRGHLHHKLLEMGLSHRQISLFYFFGSVMLGAAAMSLSSQGKLFAAMFIAVLIVGAILWLNFFGDSLKPQDPDSG